jgi:chemotaxis protein MotB
VPEGKPTIRDPIRPEAPRGRLPELARELEKYVRERHLEEDVHTRVEERGLVVSLVSDHVLFAIGSADIRPGAHKLLDKIATLIAKLPNAVTVEGHTCSLPIRTARFPSNWELSAQRATAVVRYFIQRHRISPNRLSAAGYADSKPLVPNDSELHRRRNRRVDIVILHGGPDQEYQWEQQQDSPDIYGPPHMPVVSMSSSAPVHGSEE